MRVKRLIINSFRGIGYLKLDFPETEPTVFIGINGVGKSSLLDCLALLLSHLIEGIQNPTNSGRDFSDQDSTNGLFSTDNEITISLDSREVTWSLIKFREGFEDFALHKQSNLTKLKELTREINHQWKADPKANIPLAVYYPVNRAVFDIPLEVLKEHPFKQIEAYDKALTRIPIGFERFFQWFRLQEDAENELRLDNSDYRDRQLEAVRQAIYLLLPGFSDLRIRRSIQKMIVKKQGQWLQVNQLSDGEKCLLALTGDLATRLAIANPGLPAPLQGSGVVLIDEIELHLHPKWQREIIPALTRTFPNCQFIVTTHSPQVISEVKPESIYILEKTDDGIIARRPESSFGRDSNRILEDLMDTPARPQEIKESLLDLFRLIDQGNLDGARQLRQHLADQIGADEPEFVKADVLIRRKEILNR